MITPYIIEELERDLYNTEWFSLSFSVEVRVPSRVEETPRPSCDACAPREVAPSER